jgi:hypothetical protein
LRISYASLNQGDSLVFKTSLNEVTIGYECSISLSGTIEVKLDGQIIDTIDSHSSEDLGPNGYLRLYRVYAQTNNTPHTITLSNINNALFYIEYMLYAR